MATNVCILQGRIPFDLKTANLEDDKKAFVGFAVSVRRNYKKEGEKYYPEDLINCKAFGKFAQHIAKHYKKGDFVNAEGALMVGEDYEKEGVEQKGQLYVHVSSLNFQQGNPKPDDGGSEKTSAKEEKAADKKTSSNPLVNGKKKNILGLS